MNIEQTLSDLSKKNKIVEVQLCDAEWRIFKIWQSVCPNEPFIAYKKDSILKRAKREGINTDNLF